MRTTIDEKTLNAIKRCINKGTFNIFSTSESYVTDRFVGIVDINSDGIKILTKDNMYDLIRTQTIELDWASIRSIKEDFGN